jgi:hypothetical protein
MCDGDDCITSHLNLIPLGKSWVYCFIDRITRVNDVSQRQEAVELVMVEDGGHKGGN